MVAAFSQGKDYDEVKFDEYVIISTEELGHDDNGKIYRRGYDYTNSLGGAEFICQIKGAGGASPNLLLTTVQAIEEMKTQDGVSFTGEGEYSRTDNNLVPGKVDENTYNDSIKWAYCSVKNADGTESISYIGFQFPYTVIEYEAESVSPYYSDTLVQREDTSDHPFYEKWSMKIPKGVKGDSIDSVRVVTANDEIESYNGQTDDIQGNRQVIVYDSKNYDNSEDGETQTLYLGDFNMIQSISMDDEGTLTIHYTHDDDQVITVIGRWITAVHLSEDGYLTIDYTTGETGEVENQIKWVNNMYISDSGQLIVVYNDGATEIVQDSIKWITDVSLADNGTFTVKYSEGVDDYTTQLVFPTDVNIDTGDNEGEGTQQVVVTYSDDSTETVGNPLNYVMDMAMAEDDYHVLLLFSDPAKRQEIIAAGKNYTYDGRNDWYDLGAVKDESGILIGLNLDTSYFTNGTSHSRIIAQLNEDYPNGLPSSNTELHGKIITVGDEDEIKELYAFDYQNETWYYLGTASADEDVTETQGVLVGYEDNDELIQQGEDLPIGTVWLIVED